MRFCTKEYKIEQVEQAIRRDVLHLNPRQRIPKGTHVNMMIGISTDEIERVKPSRTNWITRIYPLIYEREMSRTDCVHWMKDNGYKEPPRSSCLICPYHSDSEWVRLKRNPKYWEHIKQVDNMIRNGLVQTDVNSKLFLHRSGVPIDEVKFKDDGDGVFAEECEGMCGI